MEIKKSEYKFSENSLQIQNIKKKRPTESRLDIQKLFQQSVELTQIHRKLLEQNKKLKKDYQKVDQAKQQRQQFISQVQKIVKQKSHQLTSKNQHHQSSWLVVKLHQKIFDLKQQIQVKDKAIRKLNLSKENQVLFRKQIETQCLKQINQYAQQAGLLPDQDDQQEQIENKDQLEEIVWIDDYLQSQKQKIQELQSQFQQEERETKRLLTQIASKKAQIKKMKQAQRQYFTVQESFIQEKKKKQQKSVDNKGYLTDLMQQRDIQIKKLGQLRQKRARIQQEQNASIQKLKNKLQSLKKLYQQNRNKNFATKQKTPACIKTSNTQQWVKRVSIHEVQNIAKNLNYHLALRGVNQQKWIAELSKENNQQYSIQQIMTKLGNFPFEMKNQEYRKLIARYTVEDNDIGLMLEDMQTSQDAPIIKSILSKLIGPIKVYSPTQIAHYQQQTGNKLSKYWSLVQQSIHIKQGVKNFITRQILEQGIQSSELQFSPQQIDYTVLYLFSWSKDISKLDLKQLGKMKQLGINFNK